MNPGKGRPRSSNDPHRSTRSTRARRRSPTATRPGRSAQFGSSVAIRATPVDGEEDSGKPGPPVHGDDWSWSYDRIGQSDRGVTRHPSPASAALRQMDPHLLVPIRELDNDDVQFRPRMKPSQILAHGQAVHEAREGKPEVEQHPESLNLQHSGSEEVTDRHQAWQISPVGLVGRHGWNPDRKSIPGPPRTNTFPTSGSRTHHWKASESHRALEPYSCVVAAPVTPSSR